MSRSIIDSLILELGFNTDGMKQGERQARDSYKKVREEAKKTGDEVDDASKKSINQLEKLRNNVVALFGAFTAGKGLKEFVTDVTSANSAMGRFAKSIGASVETVSRARSMASILGVSPDEAAATLSNISNQIQQKALTGQDNGLMQGLYALRIQPIGEDGKPLDPQALVDKIRDTLNARGTPIATQSTLLRGMGFTEATIQTMQLTDEQYKKLRVDSEALTQANKEDAKAAAERAYAWNNFKAQLETVGVKLLTVVTPALVGITKVVTAFAEFLQGHPILAGALFTALAGAVGLASLALLRFTAGGTIGSVVTGFKMMRTGLGFIVRLLPLLATRLLPALGLAIRAVGAAMVATPFGAILAGLAALGFAAYEVYKHWDSIKGWWHSFWEVVGDDADKAADRVDGAKKRMNQDNSKPAPPNTASVPGGDAAWKAALDGEKKYGVPASVTYAQFMLESGGGKRMPAGSNNPFGIKARAGQPFVEAWTNEQDKNGVSHRVLAKFAKFATIADAFEAHAKLLGTSKYYAKARAVANDPDKFADALTGVYATDKQYGAKLKKIMHEHDERLSEETRVALAKAAAPVPGASGAPNQQLASAVTSNNTQTNSSVSTSSSETNIQNMHVHSAAKDATGIAGDIKDQLRRDVFVSQTNGGPQ